MIQINHQHHSDNQIFIQEKKEPKISFNIFLLHNNWTNKQTVLETILMHTHTFSEFYRFFPCYWTKTQSTFPTRHILYKHSQHINVHTSMYVLYCRVRAHTISSSSMLCGWKVKINSSIILLSVNVLVGFRCIVRVSDLTIAIAYLSVYALTLFFIFFSFKTDNIELSNNPKN